jgi:hypothetical protein
VCERLQFALERLKSRVEEIDQGLDVGLTTSSQWTANGLLPPGNTAQETAVVSRGLTSQPVRAGNSVSPLATRLDVERTAESETSARVVRWDVEQSLHAEGSLLRGRGPSIRLAGS